MAFECMFVCHDPAVYVPIERGLRNLSISTNACLSPSKAVRMFADSDTDLVVIDWEGQASSALLQEIWASPKKRKPTILAVSACETSITGAHFVLLKPVRGEGVTEPLRLAYSQMLREYRRRARCPVMISLMATDKNGRTIPVTVKDIGDGGVGLRVKETVYMGDVLSFRMGLPGSRKEIYAEVRVVWTAESGIAGCEFVRIPPLDVDLLHEWMLRNSRVKAPLFPL